MTANPKPPVRVKARKPLKRTAKPRAKKNTCTIRACNRLPTAGVLCLTHAKARADELWGALVRKGRCDLASIPIRCAGPIQACHGISRGYLGTRWDLNNGFSGCAAHNLYAELRPLEWDEFLRRHWGDKYEEKRLRALNFGKGQKVDYAAVIAGLKGA